MVEKLVPTPGCALSDAVLCRFTRVHSVRATTCVFARFRQALVVSPGACTGAQDQATCSSAIRTVPLVSGLSNSEMTTLAAATTVPTSIGMA